jgi:hypothetical protein
MIVLGSRKHSLSKRKAEPPGARLGRCWLLGSAICICITFALLIDESVGLNKPMHYKQYAFIQLNHSFTEFYCLDELYHKESRWNPKAKNGSHYGIPQGRSKYLSKVNGYKQVEWGIAYNINRYGSMCKALDHFKRKGWH